jgi:hypothetical protein
MVVHIMTKQGADRGSDGGTSATLAQRNDLHTPDLSGSTYWLVPQGEAMVKSRTNKPMAGNARRRSSGTGAVVTKKTGSSNDAAAAAKTAGSAGGGKKKAVQQNKVQRKMVTCADLPDGNDPTRPVRVYADGVSGPEATVSSFARGRGL